MDLTDSSFKFQGSFYSQRSQLDNKIKFSQSIIKPLRMKLNDRKFDDLKQFYSAIAQLSEEKISKSPDTLPKPDPATQPKKPSLFSTAVLKKMISSLDTKKATQCLSTDGSDAADKLV